MTRYIKPIPTLLACLAVLITSPLFAGDVHPNTLRLGLGGYSPVTYFQSSGPQLGSAKYQATHETVTYLFTSEAERNKFKANPGRYAPAYGGWCAYGMAVQGQFPADPTNYKIVNNKLFVFLRNDQIDTCQVWNEGDQAQLTAKADAHWDKLHNKPSRAYLGSQNVSADGVALSGYSPVAYFTVGYAEKGSTHFAVEHQGVTYLLTSDEEVKLFKANPDKYAPAFGGWCAFGMSVSDKFPVDPTNFKIEDGRLMVFLRNQNIDARALWNKGDKNELKAKAGAHWKKIQG